MVICRKCAKQMQLVRFAEGPNNPEKYIYECSPCGVLQHPKNNIPDKIVSEAEIIKTAVEMGLALDDGVLAELSKGKQDFFSIFNMCRMQDRNVVTMLDLKGVSNERDK